MTKSEEKGLVERIDLVLLLKSLKVKALPKESWISVVRKVRFFYPDVKGTLRDLSFLSRLQQLWDTDTSAQFLSIEAWCGSNSM